MSDIPTLDLHGVKHHKVEHMVEDFVLVNETPMRIITGNSTSMHDIVQEVLGRHDLQCDYENHWNLGAVIVTELS